MTFLGGTFILPDDLFFRMDITRGGSAFSHWDLAAAASFDNLYSSPTLSQSFAWPSTPTSPLNSAAYQLQLSAARLSPPSSPSSAPHGSPGSSPSESFPFSRLLSQMSVRASIADSLTSYCTAIAAASQDSGETNMDDTGTSSKKHREKRSTGSATPMSSSGFRSSSPPPCTWPVPTKASRSKDRNSSR